MRDFFKNYDYLLRLKYLVYLLGILTILSFLARYSILLELLNSFRVHYFILLLLFSIPFFLKKKWVYAISFLLLSLVNLSQFIHLYFTANQSTAEDPEKIFILNVLTANKDHQAVLDLITKENPDHITLTEVNSRWSDQIENALSKSYPYVATKPRSDNFGIMFLSKKKFEFEIIDAHGIPVIKSIFPAKTILSIHPLPPINASYFEQRNKLLANIKNWIDEDENNIVCGDFNTVPWSPYFKDMAEENKLRSCNNGFGVQTTWPTNLPFLRIPIDHCMISENGFVQSFKRLSSVGSDHFPILVEFSFKE